MIPVEEAISSINQIVRAVSLRGTKLAEYRLKLQNAKIAIESLENELADMEDREVESFEELAVDREVKPKVVVDNK